MRYLLISIAILILSFLNFFQPVQDVSIFLLNPLQKVFHSAGVGMSKYAKFFANISSIYEENQDLKEEILVLQNEIVSRNALIEENLAVVEHSAEFEDISYHLIANLLGNPSDPTKSVMYIDKGSRQGVALNSPVIYKNNIVGKVTSVSVGRSQVTLLSSPQISVSVKNISSKTPLEGIVTGEFGIGLKLERILQREELKVGDVFVTSGKDGVFPPDIVVGKVTEIYSVPTEPLKSARIMPLIEIDKLTKVFVLLEEIE